MVHTNKNRVNAYNGKLIDIDNSIYGLIPERIQGACKGCALEPTACNGCSKEITDYCRQGFILKKINL